MRTAAFAASCMPLRSEESREGCAPDTAPGAHGACTSPGRRHGVPAAPPRRSSSACALIMRRPARPAARSSRGPPPRSGSCARRVCRRCCGRGAVYGRSQLRWASVGAVGGFRRAAAAGRPTSGPHRRALQAAGLGLSNDAWAEHDEQLSRAKLAKRAWLARRDAPVWGPSAGAAAAAPEAASAPVFADDATRDESDDAASEGEAKRAWLAKQDASAWGQGGAAAAAAVAPAYAADAAAAPVAPAPAASEEAAKAAWLASRDQTGYSRDTQRRLGL